MKIYHSDNTYGKKYLINSNYTYKMEKGDNGKWGITELTYGFAEVIPLEKGEKTKHGRVAVTEEARPILEKLKNADEYRLKKEIANRLSGFENVPLGEWHEEYNSEYDPDPCYTRLARRESRAELEAVIDMLTVKQQRVIRLMFFADYSNSMIANILGIKESTVTRRRDRALIKMKEILDKRQLIA
jgi:RNA polymerase sigma factor (sigma-70 family)